MRHKTACRTFEAVNVLRWYYLSVYLGLGAVLPLLALAMQARGFRPSEYAWLMATIPLSRLLAPPVWGAIADKWLGTTRLLQVNTLVSALAMATLSQRLPFSVTVVAFVVWAMASSSLVPLAEAGTYRLLGDRAARFAYVRVFGSVGFALSALTVGTLGVGRDLSAAFWAGAAGYLAAGVVAHRIPGGHVTTRKPLLPVVKQLARRGDVLSLWVGSTLYYAAHGAYDVYYGPHIRTLTGVTDRMVSLYWALGVVAEIFVMLWVPRLLRGARVGRVLLVVTALVSAMRWLGIAHATTAAALWWLQPLHAITFGVWYLAFVHESQSQASEEVRATVQGLSVACMGLGMISATLVGGYLFERFGGQVLFDTASALALCSLVAYALRVRLVERPAEPPLAASASRP